MIMVVMMTVIMAMRMIEDIGVAIYSEDCFLLVVIIRMAMVIIVVTLNLSCLRSAVMVST